MNVSYSDLPFIIFTTDAIWVAFADENCTSDWPLMMQLAQVEVLIFNL